jgi:hypothetical protein
MKEKTVAIVRDPTVAQVQLPGLLAGKVNDVEN